MFSCNSVEITSYSWVTIQSTTQKLIRLFIPIISSTFQKIRVSESLECVFRYQFDKDAHKNVNFIFFPDRNCWD